MPAFNASLYIDAAIDSIQAQTFSEWELVIVDDGSSDTTLEIARNRQERDARITVVTQENQGEASARNAALKYCRYNYTAFLDADDIWKPSFLASVYDYLSAHPELDVISCNIERLYESGEVRAQWTDSRYQGEFSLSFDDFISSSKLAMMCVVRTQLLKNIDGFPEGFKNPDYAMWLNAFYQGAQHLHIPKTLGIYRMHDSQITQDVRDIRRNDIKLLEYFSATHTLTSEQKNLFQQTIRKHKRNLLLRNLLYRLIGVERTEQIILSRRLSAESS